MPIVGWYHTASSITKSLPFRALGENAKTEVVTAAYKAGSLCFMILVTVNT